MNNTNSDIVYLDDSVCEHDALRRYLESKGLTVYDHQVPGARRVSQEEWDAYCGQPAPKDGGDREW